jgi:hypothetical protein
MFIALSHSIKKCPVVGQFQPMEKADQRNEEIRKTG